MSSFSGLNKSPTPNTFWYPLLNNLMVQKKVKTDKIFAFSRGLSVNWWCTWSILELLSLTNLFIERALWVSYTKMRLTQLLIDFNWYMKPKYTLLNYLLLVHDVFKLSFLIKKYRKTNWRINNTSKLADKLNSTEEWRTYSEQISISSYRLQINILVVCMHFYDVITESSNYYDYKTCQ